ncbi:MAG: hypothetical protein LC792_20870, partial [Actinobacteria bacterium]|nr:hypothetical protein [Actinomycetota bacterium]
MFRKGKPSWRFGTDLSGILHAALFVRDALDLPVGAGAPIPPRLEGDVPDLTSQLSAQARPDGAAAWPAWWETLLRLELRKDELAGDPERIREHLGNLTETVDAPEWASLHDRPALRSAAQVAFEDGRRWADAALKPVMQPNQTRPLFRWDWIRDVAEQVAGERAVDVGAVHGSAQVLLVEGSWWTLLEPRVVL